MMIRKDWPHFPLLKPNFRVGKEFFPLSRKKRITGPVSVNHHSLVIRTDVISPQAPAFTYTCLKMHCTCAVNVKTKFFLTNALMYQGHLHYQIHTKMKGKWHFSVKSCFRQIPRHHRHGAAGMTHWRHLSLTFVVWNR